MEDFEEMKERNLDLCIEGKKRFKSENAFIVSEINKIRGKDDIY